MEAITSFFNISIQYSEVNIFSEDLWELYVMLGLMFVSREAWGGKIYEESIVLCTSTFSYIPTEAHRNRKHPYAHNDDIHIHKDALPLSYESPPFSDLFPPLGFPGE